MSSSVQVLQDNWNWWIHTPSHLKKNQKKPNKNQNHISKERFPLSLRWECWGRGGGSSFGAINISGAFSDKSATESSLSWDVYRNNRTGYAFAWQKFKSLPKTSEEQWTKFCLLYWVPFVAEFRGWVQWQDMAHNIFHFHASVWSRWAALSTPSVKKNKFKKSTKLRTFFVVFFYLKKYSSPMTHYFSVQEN